MEGRPVATTLELCAVMEGRPVATALELRAVMEGRPVMTALELCAVMEGRPVATTLDLRAATERRPVATALVSCVLPRRTACGDNTGQLCRQHWSAVRRATAVGSPKNQDDLQMECSTAAAVPAVSGGTRLCGDSRWGLVTAAGAFW